MTGQVVIEGKIESWSIVDETPVVAVVEQPKAAPIVIEDKIFSRDRVLHGITIKTKFSAEESMYVTVNFDDQNIPREVFINKSSSESDEWAKAISRLISAIMRRSKSIDDAKFLIDDLLRIKGDDVFSNGSRLVFGAVQALGFVLKEAFEYAKKINTPVILNDVPESKNVVANAQECPSCHEMSYVNEGGCWKCRDCGYSKCG